MTPIRNRVEGADDAPKASPEPDETDSLVVSASADSTDTDVLRAVLRRLAEGQAQVHDVLTQLGPGFFRDEMGWRRLFVRLLETPTTANEFKRRALADYLNWLEVGRGAVSKPDADALRQSTAESSVGAGRADLVKLVRGAPTPVRFDNVKRIECCLGQCSLWISPGAPPKLAIIGQRSLSLEVGRIRIGRGPGNDVVLGERWRSVSRRHLVIEVTRARDILLTDISTYGTLVTKASV